MKEGSSSSYLSVLEGDDIYMILVGEVTLDCGLILAVPELGAGILWVVYGELVPFC
jgi:hypothetical protein